MPEKLPDKLLPHNYEYTADLSLKGWAWEALRRNKAYRANYEEYLNERQKLQDEYGDDWCELIVGYNPPKKNDESVEAWKARVIEDEGNPRALNLSGQYAHKWGLLKMHNPQEKYSNEISFVPVNAPFAVDLYDNLHEHIPAHVVDDGERAETIVAPHVGVIVFDLTRSFDSQVDRARELVSERVSRFQTKQKKTIKQNQTVWRRHIRVLDALDSDIKFSGEEIVRFFGDHFNYADLQKTGGDYKRRAKEFTQGHLSILNGYYSE
ncbi:MAG: hypothetical protein IT559_04420 [Alphaproteobacteria bacterium]|nr:hypothetical protein [Alphaproteobacteria bacterium]